MPVIAAERIAEIYRDVAMALGADDREADLFARCFLRADLRNHSTQGIGYVPLVIEWLRDGVMRFGVDVEVLNEGPSYAVVHGHNGVGQVVACDAMQIAIDKATSSGIGCVWLRHSNDFTMAASYALLALEQGMVGLAMSNGAPEAAAWGGRTPVLSTNPIAVAFPVPDSAPVVVDMATSSSSHGEVVLAARDGRLLPGPNLVDDQGRLVSDPSGLVVDTGHRESPLRGAIAPLGPKGFGWMLIVELFAGLLSGMSASADIVYPPTAETPTQLGQFFMAIDHHRVASPERYGRAARHMIDAVKASEPAEGFEQVVLPGEYAGIEQERRQRRGVPVRDEEWALLVAAAAEVGVQVLDDEESSARR